MRIRLAQFLAVGCCAVSAAGCSFGIDSASPDSKEQPVATAATSEEDLITVPSAGATIELGDEAESLTTASSVDDSEADTTTSTAELTTTTTSTTTTSQDTEDSSQTTPTEPENEDADQDSGDAESDLRFDFGQIAGASGLASDRVTIEFDRYQLSDGAQGPSLTAEVRLEGATDLNWANENPRLRTYVLSSAVEALALDPNWLLEVCSGSEFTSARYQTIDVAEFMTRPGLVSLTFDGQGQVIRLREQTPC